MYIICSINVGGYILGEMEHDGVFSRENICQRILAICKTYDIDIICTQEDILLESKDSIVPEYSSLYQSYGYEFVNYDVFQENMSNILESVHTDISVKIGNVIYVKSSLKSISSPISTNMNSMPACMCEIKFKTINIANVHLCGGRFDDENVFLESELSNTKLESIKSITNTIVCGDFNSTRGIGEPGGLKDMEYPNRIVLKSGIDIKSSTIAEIWNTWQCGPINFFYQHPNYLPSFNDEQLKVVNETSKRGHYVVDWIFFNPYFIQKMDSHCECMYDIEDKDNLSDHHMLLFTFSIKSDSTNRNQEIMKYMYYI